MLPASSVIVTAYRRVWCNFCLELLSLILCVWHHQHSPDFDPSSDDQPDFEQSKHPTRRSQAGLHQIYNRKRLSSYFIHCCRVWLNFSVHFKIHPQPLWMSDSLISCGVWEKKAQDARRVPVVRPLLMLTTKRWFIGDIVFNKRLPLFAWLLIKLGWHRLPELESARGGAGIFQMSPSPAMAGSGPEWSPTCKQMANCPHSCGKIGVSPSQQNNTPHYNLSSAYYYHTWCREKN